MTDLFDTASSDPASENAAYSADGKVDRYGRYRLPHPATGIVQPFTRVTTFAKSIADTYKLSQWSCRMAVKGVTMRPDIYAAVASTPLEDKDQLNKLVETAKEVAGAKTAAGLGTAIHSFSEARDRGETITPGPWSDDIDLYSATMKEHGLIVEPHLIERKILNLRYGVAGTFDRIVRLPEPCARCGKVYQTLDLKTGRDLSYGWNEIAVQLALYANADFIWDIDSRKYTDLPETCRCSAIVVWLPALPKDDLHHCEMFDVNIMEGWIAAGLCAQVREWRSSRTLAVPRTVSRPDWRRRIELATTPGDLSAIRSEALAKGEWSQELLDIGLEKLVRIRAETAGG